MPKKGKGKKDNKGKKGKKKKDDTPLKMDARNTTLWEARLNIADTSRKHCREVVGTLAGENETLRDQLRQTEKDTIDVVSFLKKQDMDKDTEIERLQQEINTLQVEQSKDKQELVSR
ncbi:unnamed protein product [Rotaria magnacalcarata]|uniref:Basal body-orientation factor 1 n=1 Tax=Rotaria magnacalcarata TaxID=392030 RepID=A0A8S3HXC9_9BILA|nr:unnamed protein product [Rotaria magnacalcarata]CAF5188400.1 unnamed protein product [Rotaria magnacalcarata]CAF5190265.1 unnamed protein product [Rotaria magnacalcarata]